MDSMYYIGLDVHKKTISYCIKNACGQVQREGTIGERQVRMLVICTPAGFERFVLDQATPIAEPPSQPDMGRLMALAERHGIEIQGPLPEGPSRFTVMAEAAPISRKGLQDARYITHF